jgi:hypothetical protein
MILQTLHLPAHPHHGNTATVAIKSIKSYPSNCS